MSVPVGQFIVIVGAGKTGRGFLARLVSDSGYAIVFVDRNPDLVARICDARSYAIHFFGDARDPFLIEGVSAVSADSAEASDLMARADLMLTAIGATNLPSLSGSLRLAARRREALGLGNLRVVVCENGVSPSASLRETLKDEARIEIGEAAIFCSTVEKSDVSLDIQSEPYDELPFDLSRFTMAPAIRGARAIPDFPKLLKRKIYTYNCLSACIAYPGAYKGYRWLYEATNDEDIAALVQRVAESLNDVLAGFFEISREDQASFFDMAVSKFQDPNILDDVKRNAQDVRRKSGGTERLIAPLELIYARGGDLAPLALVTAFALHYGERFEPEFQTLLNQHSAGEVLSLISGLDERGTVCQKVVEFYDILKSADDRKLTEILRGERYV